MDEPIISTEQNQVLEPIKDVPVVTDNSKTQTETVIDTILKQKDSLSPETVKVFNNAISVKTDEYKTPIEDPVYNQKVLSEKPYPQQGEKDIRIPLSDLPVLLRSLGNEVKIKMDMALNDDGSERDVSSQTRDVSFRNMVVEISDKPNIKIVIGMVDKIGFAQLYGDMGKEPSSEEIRQRTLREYDPKVRPDAKIYRFEIVNVKGK